MEIIEIKQLKECYHPAVGFTYCIVGKAKEGEINGSIGLVTFDDLIQVYGYKKSVQDYLGEDISKIEHLMTV